MVFCLFFLFFSRQTWGSVWSEISAGAFHQVKYAKFWCTFDLWSIANISTCQTCTFVQSYPSNVSMLTCLNEKMANIASTKCQYVTIIFCLVDMTVGVTVKQFECWISHKQWLQPQFIFLSSTFHANHYCLFTKTDTCSCTGHCVAMSTFLFNLIITASRWGFSSVSEWF